MAGQNIDAKSVMKICLNCGDPTRKPIGFWDGQDISGKSEGGPLITCENGSCPHYALNREAVPVDKIKKAEEKREEMHRINLANGVHVKTLDTARKKAGMLTYHCAMALGISSVQMSRYLNEAESMPTAMYDLLMAEIENRLEKEDTGGSARDGQE